MLDPSDIVAAADLLWAHWQAGTLIDGLPPQLRPTSRAEGYAIQALLEKRSAVPLFGWKIAATSKAGQQHINVDGPLAGRVLAESVLPMDRPITIGANQMLVAEPEFCFRFGADLAPRGTPYTTAEVMAAVDKLYLAIELPDSRYVSFVTAGAAQLIADNACGHQFILGPEAPPLWRDIDLVQHAVTGTVADQTGRGTLTREGAGANVLGDPRIGLAWLVNEMVALGTTLRAGEVVTTGTCMVPLPITPGAVIAADYGSLGRMLIRFAAES
jgi:2-keto-4-pentenoate hydratase